MSDAGTRPADGPETGHCLELNRVFEAAVERVYRAFADAGDIARWFGPQGFSCKVLEFDCRSGGRYSVEMTAPDGAIYPLSGAFRDVDPPRRLAYSWIWGGDSDMAGQRTEVAIDFIDLGGRTEVRLTHDLLPTAAQLDGHRGGWSSSWEDLAALLQT